MKTNIKYESGNIANFFANNRINWSQFYNSEKKIINNIMLNKESTVLDVGCGCGGLGLALYEEFGVTEYSGVDIHEAAVNEAKRMNSNAEFYCGDILKLTDTDLMGEEFSSVFSLSCVDWNVQFLEMLNGSNLKFQHIIELNAGAALYLADIVKDLKNGFQLAKNVIDKKISKNYFQKLIK